MQKKEKKEKETTIINSKNVLKRKLFQDISSAKIPCLWTDSKRVKGSPY